MKLAISFTIAWIYIHASFGFKVVTGNWCQLRCGLSLFAATPKANDKILSKQQQEELWEANSAYFHNKDYQEVKHITSNTWPRSSYGRKLRKRAARPWMKGVEIRQLRAPHPLAGQLGLFAATPFEQFDIVGEYCGQVYDANDGGEYATYLENRNEKYALGVDAATEGNECRFINHYKGIADEPNSVMKITYVEELPRVMIVCTKDVDVGQEFLLSYSDEYLEEYMSNS